MARTLLIPAVSSGNIPQLSVGLLLHSLDSKIISRLDDKYLYPFVGPQDTTDATHLSEGLTTSIDVYQSGDITLIQQRSPTLPGYKQKFIRETLVPFIERGSFDRILVLGSSNAALRTEHSGNKFEFYSESLVEKLSGLSLSSNTVKPVPENLPESGVVSDLVRCVPNSCAVVIFAYEGDNFGDAELMAGQVSKVLSLDVNDWQRPQSWQGAYGKDIPTGLEAGLYS